MQPLKLHILQVMALSDGADVDEIYEILFADSTFESGAVRVASLLLMFLLSHSL